MAFVQVLLQLIGLSAAFHLQLQEVEQLRSQQIPGFGDLVKSAKDAAKDAAGDVTDAVTDSVKDTVSDLSDAVSNFTDPIASTLGDIIDKVGNASNKALNTTKAITNALKNADNVSAGDIAKAVASASDVVNSVTSIFKEDNEGPIYRNMTAASKAAKEAAQIATTLGEAHENYHDAKKQAQEAAKASLREAEKIASKTNEAIEASETAFQILEDKVNGKPTNLSLEVYTKAASEASIASQKAVDKARKYASVHKEHQAEADKYMNQTLEAALKVQAKMDETIKDSSIASGLLKAKLEKIEPATTTTTIEEPSEAPTTQKSGATGRMSVAPVSVTLVMALVAAAPASVLGVQI